MFSPALLLPGEALDPFLTCLGSGEVRAGTTHPSVSWPRGSQGCPSQFPLQFLMEGGFLQPSGVEKQAEAARVCFWFQRHTPRVCRICSRLDPSRGWERSREESPGVPRGQGGCQGLFGSDFCHGARSGLGLGVRAVTPPAGPALRASLCSLGRNKLRRGHFGQAGASAGFTGHPQAGPVPPAQLRFVPPAL